MKPFRCTTNNTFFCKISIISLFYCLFIDKWNPLYHIIKSLDSKKDNNNSKKMLASNNSCNQYAYREDAGGGRNAHMHPNFLWFPVTVSDIHVRRFVRPICKSLEVETYSMVNVHIA